MVGVLKSFLFASVQFMVVGQLGPPGQDAQFRVVQAAMQLEGETALILLLPMMVMAVKETHKIGENAQHNHVQVLLKYSYRPGW